MRFDSLGDAAGRVAYTFGLPPEVMADILAQLAADFGCGASRAAAVEALLRRADEVIFDTIFVADVARDEGRPDTMSAELEQLRRLASGFAEQASRLVHPRLAGSHWPRRQSPELARH